MIQEIIVGMIGLLILGIVCKRIYLFFFGKEKNKMGCACSDCPCSAVKR